MDRLSPLDNAFLEAEDADRRTSLAIASVAVFDGPEPTYDEFAAALAGRLPLVPRYRQKVRRVPLDLGAPVWVDDPHFDLRWHIRQTALPPPGGDSELCRLTARVMGQRLDRDRPLWEYWLVSGLADGRWALISKVHHCMVDGVAGTDLYRVLLDLTPEPAPPVPDDWQPSGEPSTIRLTANAIRDLVINPVDQARALAGLLRHRPPGWHSIVDTGGALVRIGQALIPVSATTLSGHIGQQRRYAMARATLDDVRVIRRELGGTVNDVVLAAITAGFRALLLDRGDQLAPHSVRSLVPVSVRPPGTESDYGNQVSLMLAFLPVHVVDPVQRLDAVRSHLAALKSSKEAEAGAAITRIAEHEPFPLVSLPIRAAFHLPQRSVVTVTTNVPGPRQPLFALGRQVIEITPYVPIASTLRIGIAIFSYNGRLTFGITGDYDTASDVDVLARGIESGLAELVAAATGASRRGTRGNLTTGVHAGTAS